MDEKTIDKLFTYIELMAAYSHIKGADGYERQAKNSEEVLSTLKKEITISLLNQD